MSTSILDGNNKKLDNIAKQLYGIDIKIITMFISSFIKQIPENEVEKLSQMFFDSIKDISDNINYNAYERFKDMTKKYIITKNMKQSQYNSIIRLFLFILAGFKIANDKKDVISKDSVYGIPFTYKELYNAIYEICDNKYLNFYSGNETTNIVNWEKRIQTIMQEFSPSSRQYWVTRKFNEYRKFPLFFNIELSIAHNEREWITGTQGLKRGKGIWQFNVNLFDESTLRIKLQEKYNKTIILHEDVIRQYVNTAINNDKIEGKTYRKQTLYYNTENEKPKKLEIFI
uniref:Uncharacterized protein n=1 Tax=viral metagenome TaxID=1070528 RepID=A0A6C0F7F0_9ZZZZ|tara:strand:+ start:1779 stop:2636 length:858 start_codon:yes stop_codon:yes gene_type:complete